MSDELKEQRTKKAAERVADAELYGPEAGYYASLIDDLEAAELKERLKLARKKRGMK